jgi:thiol-disulfide isomerase/thioredoxin
MKNKKCLLFLLFFIILCNTTRSEEKINKDYYVIKWTASWCAPCKIWDNKERKKLTNKIKVIDIDIDKYPDVRDKYQISSIPQFWICQSKDKVVDKKYIGYTESDIILKYIKDKRGM